jgi:hypothetical protein
VDAVDDFPSDGTNHLESACSQESLPLLESTVNAIKSSAIVGFGLFGRHLDSALSHNPSALPRSRFPSGLRLSDWAGDGEMVVVLPHNPQNDVQQQV